jgi:hypothetical protein
MPQDRRLKLISISREQQPGKFEMIKLFESLPDDARLVNVYVNEPQAGAYFVFHSSAFPELEHGHVVPDITDEVTQSAAVALINSVKTLLKTNT